MPLRRLAPLSLGAFAVGTDVLLVAGLIPGIQAGLRVSLPAAGQLVSVFAITYAVGSPLLAILTGSANYAGIALGGVIGGLALHAGGSAAVAPTDGAIELIALALLLARRSLIEPSSDLRQPADGEDAKARQAGGRCQAGRGGTR